MINHTPTNFTLKMAQEEAAVANLKATVRNMSGKTEEGIRTVGTEWQSLHEKLLVRMMLRISSLAISVASRLLGQGPL
jgi:hypothetical protein